MLETTRNSLPTQRRDLSIHDLDQAGARLRAQALWHTHGQGAVTLIRQPELRVVLMELRAGARMLEHRTVAQVTIHALRGRVHLRIGDRRVSLAAGQLLVLDHDVTHDLVADEDSAVLLTLAWPGDPAPPEAPGAAGGAS